MYILCVENFLDEMRNVQQMRMVFCMVAENDTALWGIKWFAAEYAAIYKFWTQLEMRYGFYYSIVVICYSEGTVLGAVENIDSAECAFKFGESNKQVRKIFMGCVMSKSIRRVHLPARGFKFDVTI